VALEPSFGLSGAVAVPTHISWALAALPKYELSSRPERSEAEGPAVLSISYRMYMEATTLPFVIPRLRSLEKHFQERSAELLVPFDFAQGRLSATLGGCDFYFPL
jgi:hypothetical protein